ncbi:MAG: periplasmic heavy metal sensor [Bauldia litoralis]
MSRLSRRFLWIALIGSLAVNLFLGGFIIASVINRGWDGHHKNAYRGRLHMRAAFRALDDEARQAARAQWRQRLPEIREKLRAIREAHRAFRATLDTADGDPAAVQAALQRIHAARGEAQTAIHRAIREIGEKLTPAQRKAFYKAVFERRFRRRDRPRRQPRTD